MSDSDTEKKKVDEDWKRQAEDEKQKLAAAHSAEQEQKQGARTGGPAQSSPEFLSFLQGLIAQAAAALGQIPHPMTGATRVDLAQAQYVIDTLSVLQKKTEGNLSPEENSYMQAALTDLRMAFVEVRRGQAQAETSEPETT